MKKLTIFYRTFRKSVSSLSYYRDVVAARFTFSLKYFVMFSVMLGLFLTISIAATIVPPITKFTTKVRSRTEILYPPDLVITLKGGNISTNVAEPLRFPIPYELFTETPPAVSDQKQLYLVTIDTSAQVGDFKKSQSLVLVTKNDFVVADENNGFRVYPLKDVGDMTLDKLVADKFIKSMVPILAIIPVLVVFILLLVFTILLPISRLFTLLFLTLLLVPAARLMNLSFTYKKLYQIGLHALTLPTLIQIGMALVGLFPPIPFFTSLLYLFYSLVILAELRKSHQSPPAPLEPV